MVSSIHAQLLYSIQLKMVNNCLLQLINRRFLKKTSIRSIFIYPFDVTCLLIELLL